MSIGQALSRPDGPEKVTGRAKYAADHHEDGVLHAALVTAPIAAGRVVSIDATRALAVNGVEHVITHHDMPRLAEAPVPPFSSTFMPMQGDEIRHEGQPVAIVLADAIEAAEEAATRVAVAYERAEFKRAERGEPEMPKADSGYSWAPGDFKKGRPKKSTHTHEADYTQPSRHHNPMEPSATLARWDDGKLTMWDATQHCYGVQAVLAAIFKLAPEAVRVLAPHTGGGFGSKGFVWPHQVLAAAAAKLSGRPVRLALSRAGMYENVGFQPHMHHHVALGADAEGRLTRVRHDVVNVTSVSDDFMEVATAFARGFYATPSLQLAQRVERANINLPTPMRAPVEGPGSWAIESAMDELAHKVGMDPLDLRLANYAEKDPGTGKPWSSKKLREAYEEGARSFGWRERPRQPQRDGHWIFGQGMASCSMGNFRNPGEAAVRLRADGTALVETGTQDIGTGTLTIFPQIAADVLGLPFEKVETRIGDTHLPKAGPTYGSSSTMGTGSAVLRAAEDIRAQLARLANLPPDEVEMRDGRIRRREGISDGIPIADLMREAGHAEMVGNGKFTLPGGADSEENGGKGKFAMRTFGAIFVEVAVDSELGLLRLRRAVGAYSAGRIINPKTARSQMIGGIIWGWGQAAMEASVHEPNLGRWLSKDLAGVAVPVNADIPAEIQIRFVDEFDPHASALGARGIGELGATGVAAAVANAVFHATGKRIRELPITPARLVGG